MTCREIEGLLALGAAGLLEALEERQVREHARECAACAARLEGLAELAEGLRSLPAPAPPAHLAALVARDLAEYADRRQSLWLAAGSAVLGWVMALATWYGYHLVTGGAGLWWLGWTVVAAAMTAPVMAGLFRRKRRAL